MAKAIKTASVLSFSGVALADIMANGVAIIVIMIVVTLMVRHEQEQEKLEQAEDISVLLSREIASSLVMNSLPTSAPAVLHDYINSPLDKNPNHSQMPIIELHADFVRNYYTGHTYRRDELLKQYNAFDRYLSNLSKEQLQAIRIDVYSIAQFYIAMSILKDHDHKPRHWHFMTAKKNITGTDQGSGTEQEGIFRTEKQYDDNEWKKSLARSLSAKKDGSQSLPEDVELSSMSEAAQQLSQRLPFGSGLFSNSWQDFIGLPPVQKETEIGDWSSFQQFGQGKGKRSTDKIFRTAFQMPNQAIQRLQKEHGIDNFTLMRVYFSFMEAAQKKIDLGLPGALHNFDFRRDILEKALHLPKQISEEDQSFFDDLAYWLDSPLYLDDETITVNLEKNAALDGQHIVLAANMPIQSMRWLRDRWQPPLPNLPPSVTLTIGINAHPEIYQSINIPIAQDSLLLTPRISAPDPKYRWRIATIINPEVNDFATGFVYAAVNNQNELVLPVDENAVGINHTRLTPTFPRNAFLTATWQLVIYSLLVITILLTAIHRYRKSA